MLPLNLLWTRSSYFCLFFPFKYDAVIIKQPSSCTFDIKVVKLKKNHRCLVLPHKFGKMLAV